MQTVRLTQPFDWPTRLRADGVALSTKAYPSGYEGPMPDGAATMAVEQGKGTVVPPPEPAPPPPQTPAPAAGDRPRRTRHEGVRG